MLWAHWWQLGRMISHWAKTFEKNLKLLTICANVKHHKQDPVNFKTVHALLGECSQQFSPALWASKSWNLNVSRTTASKPYPQVRLQLGANHTVLRAASMPSFSLSDTSSYKGVAGRLRLGFVWSLCVCPGLVTEGPLASQAPHQWSSPCGSCARRPGLSWQPCIAKPTEILVPAMRTYLGGLHCEGKKPRRPHDACVLFPKKTTS